MNHTFIKSIPFIFSLLFALNLSAQNTALKKYTSSNKGKFFISWGGNRESYSKSDITFKGKDYRFTIKDASAHDKPKGWHIDYINPTRITIPQTNFKLGYFISDHYSVSIGVDHMKYVMNRNKTKTLDGFINLPDNEVGSVYNGIYNNESFFVSEEFLKFEHTDGLNYINAEFSRVDDISNLFKINNTDKIQINLSEGFGAGVLYPKTNTTLLGKERYDEFHVAGYGVSVRAGLNVTFCKYFFIQTDLKGGFINMNDIRTTKSSSDRASQHFWFLQRIVSLGGVFRI